MVTGTLIAWVLVRDEFRGKAIVNAVIDLPFALPTIVASIVLLSLYGPRSPIGLDLYATRPALIIALAGAWSPISATFTASPDDADGDHERRRAALRRAIAGALVPPAR